ncbi:uncharacterized protein PRCAT00004340001 [Priceomyces carsonii]|uniref:uncharacterized protein n=1 Tax=Priceomyces carsonii TaxID=28549 RepID=UPI002EDB07D8|nr:unnamed protein product [Priceomyces carsonii]
MANLLSYTYYSKIYKDGLNDKKPLSTKFHVLEQQAKDILPAAGFGYVHNCAGSLETDEKNKAAFKRWSILPTRLVGPGFPDLSVKLFGEKYDYPVALAPIGVQKVFHPKGEIAASSAAFKEDVPYILSTATATSLEDVAKSNENGKRWYQLYWPANENNDITASLLNRAKNNGFKVLVVTLDTYVLGWRPGDIDNAYNPFIKADNIGVAIGTSDPVFRKKFKEKYGVEVEEDMQNAAPEWTSTIFPQRNHSWEDIEFLKKHWDGPIVLKGIQTVSDAKKAVEYGVQGIIVSSHGGRQQDGAVGSLTVLPGIVDAVGKKLEIIFDSGIRSGADITKALALGAKFVLIGRPYIYGLAVGGEEGVRHVIKSFLSDLELTLHLSGVKKVSDLSRSILFDEFKKE